MAVNYQKFYSNLDIDEKMAFRDLTIKVMQEIYPHYIIRPVEPTEPDVVFITNKQDNVRIHFPLHDLYAHFSPTGKTKADLKDALLFHYSDMLKLAEDAEVIRDNSKLTWADVEKFLYPQFVRREELHDEDAYPKYPFGEDVYTIFNIDDRPDEHLVDRVDMKMLERWNITLEELTNKAMENFANRADRLEFAGFAPPHGYLRTDCKYQFASTAILIGGVRELVAEHVGSPFRFGVPSRYIMYAWGELEDEAFQVEMKAMMEREFERLPSKLTTKIFEVDEKGQITQLKNQPEIKTPPHVSNN